MTTLLPPGHAAAFHKLKAEVTGDPGRFVGRALLNSGELEHWWGTVRKSEEPDLDPNPHLTVAYSRLDFPWECDPSHVTIKPEQLSYGLLGPKNALVLRINSPILQSRYEAAKAAGAVSSYDSYKPHMTLFYLGAGYDSTQWRDGNLPPVPPFSLVFGPELTGQIGQDVFEQSKGVEPRGWFGSTHHGTRFNPNHDPGNGQFSEGAGGGTATAEAPDHAASGSAPQNAGVAPGAAASHVALETYQRPPVHEVSDINEAVQRVLNGEVVEMKDTRSVYTLVSKLGAMAKDAEAKGENAPNFNLCNVTVAGTNLFCASKVTTPDHPDGIPRIAMPQFEGFPEEGSIASHWPMEKNGNVDGSGDFIATMQNMGITVTKDTVAASKLKASQSELIGPKVAAIMASTTFNPMSAPIFISRDNYVIDGHHRWAAAVGKDMADGNLGDVTLDVRRVDAPISEVLGLANAWAKHVGIKPQGTNPVKMKRAIAIVFRWLAGVRFNQNHDPANGQFASGDGGGAPGKGGGAPAAEVATANFETSGQALSKVAQVVEPKSLAEAKALASSGGAKYDLPAVEKVMGFDFSRQLDHISNEAKTTTDHLNTQLNVALQECGGAMASYGDAMKGSGIQAAMGPPKSRERIAQKAILDYGGDLSRVWDTARATVAVDKISDVAKVRDAIEQHMDVVRVKDRFTNPNGDGYRDLMMNVKMPNGLHAEVQINCRSMLKAKELAHPIYEKLRALSAQAHTEAKSLTAQMYGLYSKAWAAAPRWMHTLLGGIG